MKQICMLAALLTCAACDELEEANGRGSTANRPMDASVKLDASAGDARVSGDAGALDAGDAALDLTSDDAG